MLNHIQGHSPADTVAKLGQWLVQQRLLAITQRGEFHLILAGGNTPRQLYVWLAEHTKPTDWAETHFYWGDERCVPPEHPDSNYGMALQTWLHAYPPNHIHRLQGEAEPRGEAERYQALLKTQLPAGTLDVVLLGLGSDGHTASLFPAYPELKNTPAWCVATRQPSTGQSRLSLTPAILKQAHHVVFLVTGADKAKIQQAVFQALSDYPANWIEPVDGERWLFTDTHAF